MDWKPFRRIAVPATLVVVGLAAATYWFSDSERSHGGAPWNEPPPPGFSQLEDELQRVHREWMPKRRERTIERIDRRIESLEAPILWVLARPRHPLFVDTARLAASVELESAHALLVSAATTGPLEARLAALQAAEQVQPWSTEELGRLLGDAEDLDPKLIVTVLELCLERDERPVHEIVQLLESEVPAIRQAALAALPADLPDSAVRHLLGWLDFGHDDADVAMRALASAISNPNVRERLVGRLDDAAPATKIAVLDALGEHGEVFPGADRVWSMVIDSRLDLEVRTAAMRCLEYTGAGDIDRIALELGSLPPPVRLHAARSLIAAGEREGLAELLRLGEESTEARRLLSQMSGIRIHHGMAAFRRWFDELDPGEIPALPAR